MTLTCFDPPISPGLFSLYNLLSLKHLAARLKTENVICWGAIISTIYGGYLHVLLNTANKAKQCIFFLGYFMFL